MRRFPRAVLSSGTSLERITAESVFFCESDFVHCDIWHAQRARLQYGVNLSFEKRHRPVKKRLRRTTEVPRECQVPKLALLGLGPGAQRRLRGCRDELGRL